MAEFIRGYSRETHTRGTSSVQGDSVTDLPVYIVVFLIYILAHDTNFPPEECKDKQTFAKFFWYLSTKFTIWGVFPN